MAEELKETREEFEKELEASLEKAETSESAAWARLEQMKEEGTILSLTVGCKRRSHRVRGRNPRIHPCIIIVNRICGRS